MNSTKCCRGTAKGRGRSSSGSANGVCVCLVEVGRLRRMADRTPFKTAFVDFEAVTGQWAVMLPWALQP